MSGYLHAAWDWLGHNPSLGYILVAAWLGYILCLCAWIVLQKREPVATLGWVMSLALLPYLGFLVYFLFGPQRIKRQRLRRGRSRSGMARYANARLTGTACMELARLGQATTGLPPATAHSAHWLVDGHATYAALLDAIASARHHIHLEYYIWNPDRTGQRLLDALIERARAGVQVRLLLDAVGSSAMKTRHLRPLLQAGAAFAWFHPTRLRPFTRPWVNLRTHRKIAVIDGMVGFIKVVDTPYAAKTDANGHAVIRGLPAGGATVGVRVRAAAAGRRRPRRAVAARPVRRCHATGRAGLRIRPRRSCPTQARWARRRPGLRQARIRPLRPG